MSFKAQKNKRLRTAILGLLKTEYPDSLDIKILRFSLDAIGYTLREADLSAHLRYLEEKGLIRQTTKKGYGFSISFVSLTARGWDLLDGSIKEHGVDIDL